LYWAAYVGQDEMAKVLLSHNANINMPDKNGSTPLHVAVHLDRLSMVNLLLAHDWEASPKDNAGYTPRDWAEKLGLTEIAATLRRHGARGFIEHDTPLHRAAHGNNWGEVKKLLSEGADVNARNPLEATPLHDAAQFGSKDMILAMLKHGADINARDCNGHTPLHRAAMANVLIIVEVLLANNADVSIKDSEGHTALDLAKKGSDIAVILRHFVGEEDLSGAVIRGNVSEVKQLLKSNPELMNRVDGMGRTSLFWAVFVGQNELAKLLVDEGANVNIADNSGSTVLHLATRRTDLDIVKLLLAHKAEVNVTDNEGFTPADIAERAFNQKELVASFARMAAKGGSDHSQGYTQMLDSDLRNGSGTRFLKVMTQTHRISLVPRHFIGPRGAAKHLLSLFYWNTRPTSKQKTSTD
jgi:ankyrin repeat protein